MDLVFTFMVISSTVTFLVYLEDYFNCARFTNRHFTWFLIIPWLVGFSWVAAFLNFAGNSIPEIYLLSVASGFGFLFLIGSWAAHKRSQHLQRDLARVAFKHRPVKYESHHIDDDFSEAYFDCRESNGGTICRIAESASSDIFDN